MLNVLVITKRQYTNKDLLDDLYGRIREIPFHLARRGYKVSGICLSLRHRPEGIHSDGGVLWKSVNSGAAVIPGLARFTRYTFDDLKTCDVLWACSDSLFGIIGFILSRKHRKPLVFDLYDNFESFLLARFPVFKALYRYVVRQCDAVTVVSRPLADLVRAYGRRDAVYLIENAVDPELFWPRAKEQCRSQFNLPTQARLIGTAGALFKNRGIETLFKAFIALAEKHPDVHLALAGPRDVSIPVHSRIHDAGDLEYRQIPEFFSALDVGVVCNRASSFGTYCFPQKVREMMACNTPLVAANVAGTQPIFSNHPGWLFTPEDPVDLARVIEKRLSDPFTGYGPIPTWSELAERLAIIFHIVRLRNQRPSA
jgi:glycosyltransferase involved in cell wall biosynthesis